MIEELVSIIVPVYNVAEYLDKCIKSILEQTYKSLEIILVNDGSTDDSLKICESYARMDARIRLISQENQGVAKARKKAGLQAVGKYIFFVDSDDYIDSDFISNMLEVSEGKYDLVTSGYRKGYGDNIKCFDKIEKGVYSSPEELNYIIDNMIIFNKGDERGLTPYIWNKLYRADLAKEVFYEINEDIIIAEDSEFLYRYILKCKSIFVTDICGYFYRVREGSALHSINKKYLRNVCELYDTLECVFLENRRSEELLMQLQRWIARMIAGATATMGFKREAQNINYIFPYLNLLTNKSIALYGAGKIGQDYYNQITKMNICNMEMWVDKNWKTYRDMGLNVQPIDKLTKGIYDYIVIAVINETIVYDIKTELVKMGVEEDKILWQKPYNIVM